MESYRKWKEMEKANLKVFGQKHAEGLFRFSTKSWVQWARNVYDISKSHLDGPKGRPSFCFAKTDGT